MAKAFQTCAIFTIVFCLTVPVIFHLRDWIALEKGDEFMGKRSSDAEKSVEAASNEAHMGELREVARLLQRWDFWVFCAFAVSMLVIVHTALDMYYRREVELAKEYKMKLIQSKLLNV